MALKDQLTTNLTDYGKESEFWQKCIFMGAKKIASICNVIRRNTCIFN
jgi:hypothetical protein